MSVAGVRDAHADLLRAVLPIKIPLLRDDLNLDASRLPAPDVVLSGEAPYSVIGEKGNTYIEIGTPRLLRNLGIIDWDAGRPLFHVRYSVDTYVWALAETWELAMAARDHLGQAVLLTYLEYPALSTAGGSSGMRVATAITSRSGTPVSVGHRGGGSPRVWGPMVLTHEVDSFESTSLGSTRPPLGTVETYDVNQTVVGPGENFPEDQDG